MRACPVCGAELRFVPELNRRFCSNASCPLSGQTRTPRCTCQPDRRGPSCPIHPGVLR